MGDRLEELRDQAKGSPGSLAAKQALINGLEAENAELREKLVAESNANDMIAQERDAFEQRVHGLEADATELREQWEVSNRLHAEHENELRLQLDAAEQRVRELGKLNAKNWDGFTKACRDLAETELRWTAAAKEAGIKIFVPGHPESTISILGRALHMAEERVRELEHPTGSVIRCDKCGTEETVKFQYAPESERIEALKERVRGLEIAANAWHCVFGTSQLSHARARLEDAIDGRKRAEAALADANAAIEVWQREAQSAQERADQATADTQISYGPERQDYPGGPIYRIGTSRGATIAQQPSATAAEAGKYTMPIGSTTGLWAQQASAEPFGWYAESRENILWSAHGGMQHDWQWTRSRKAADALDRKMWNVTALYTAPPSLAAAVALAVEKCAAIVDYILKEGGGTYGDAIRALSPTLTAEAEAIREDAERYRWLRDRNWHDDAICVVTNPKETVRLGTNCPSRALLDAAIDAARGKP